MFPFLANIGTNAGILARVRFFLPVFVYVFGDFRNKHGRIYDFELKAQHANALRFAEPLKRKVQWTLRAAKT